MKRLYIFCILLITNLLFTTSSLYSQDKTEYLIENLLKLYHAKNVYKDSLNLKTDTLKNYALKQFFNNSNEDYVGRPEWTIKLTLDSFITFYSSSFHLLDLNADNNIELIFSGKRFQRMGTSTIIYSFDGINFNEKYRFNGEVVQQVIREDKYVDLVICEYPCCAMLNNDFSYIEFNDSTYTVTGNITFFKGGWISHCQTSLPKTINPAKEIIINKGIELDFWYLSDSIPNCDPVNKKEYITLGITQDVIKTVYYASYNNNNKEMWYFVKITPDMYPGLAYWLKMYPNKNYLVWIKND